MNNLTKSELEVMQVLWQSDEELSSSEIVAKSAEAGAHWQKSYIHLLINSLLDKGMIEIVGFIKNAKNYSRTFKAKLSKAEYITMRLGDECGYKDCIKEVLNTRQMNHNRAQHKRRLKHKVRLKLKSKQE